MKKITGIMIIMLIATQMISAQKYITKNGHIKFYSDTPVETIEAHNRQVNSALDIQTGDFVFKVLMRGFEFEKALMQEHFNENYVESHKYPNATFTGKVKNLDDMDLSRDGIYEAIITGDLTIHGVTNKISERGTLEVKNGTLYGDAVFKVRVDDYDIRIPKTVVENIAEEIEITVDVKLDKLDS